MKKSFMILLVLIAAKTINAQGATHPQERGDTLPVSRDALMKNYVSMQGGQMILTQNNRVSRMKKDMTMKNGITVRTDGTVKMKDGHSFKLKEGDRVYMNGLIEGLTKAPID